MDIHQNTRYKSAIIILASTFFLVACSPKIAIEAPKEAITINLNVKIEHEILVKVDKEIDDLFDNQSDLF